MPVVPRRALPYGKRRAAAVGGRASAWTAQIPCSLSAIPGGGLLVDPMLIAHAQARHGAQQHRLVHQVALAILLLQKRLTRAALSALVRSSSTPSMPAKLWPSSGSSVSGCAVQLSECACRHRRRNSSIVRYGPH